MDYLFQRDIAQAERKRVSKKGHSRSFRSKCLPSFSKHLHHVENTRNSFSPLFVIVPCAEMLGNNNYPLKNNFNPKDYS